MISKRKPMSADVYAATYCQPSARRPMGWWRWAVACFAAVAIAVPVVAQEPIIETFAGGGGGDAEAELTAGPRGVAVDGSGNVYIVESSRIRKVDSSGVISTFAGTGTSGFGGDGGAATSSLLSYPRGVAVDGSGNVYIADWGNHRVRKVDSSGTVTTFAGTGARGFGGDGGAATSSMFRLPDGVAVDGSGNVYIADGYNGRVRKVDSSGTITTFAGSGTFPHNSGFSGDGGSATSSLLRYPQGVAVDGSGNVYIADTLNHRIRKVDSSGTITTFAGTGTQGFGGDGGSATSSLLSYPRGVAVDGSGNVYIADRGNNRIRKVDSSGTISTILAAPAIDTPQGVAVDGSGNVYVAEFSRVLKMDALTNEVSTLAAGSFGIGLDGVPAASSYLAFPRGVAADGSGNVYISDSRRIRKVDSSGVISTVAVRGGAGVAVDRSGDVYFAHALADRDEAVSKVGPSGNVSRVAGGGSGGDGALATSSYLWFTWGVAVDGSDNVYIAEYDLSRIRKVDSSGIISTFAGWSGTGFMEGFSGDGGSATSSLLSSARGVAVDGSGNVYIADTGNHRIRKVGASGLISTFAGSGTTTVGGFGGDGGAATSARLDNPYGVAVDGSGNVYIADRGNNRVRKVDASGIISTFAGTGQTGFGGDGGAATSARLDSPNGVAVDGSGNVYIVDAGNHRIRRAYVPRPPVAEAPEQPEPPDQPEPPAVPNAPPQVLTALLDATLTSGQTARIDLSGAFQDPDGDVLAYSAVSSAPAVVLASADGGTLVLVGVSSGVATVTVTATDPHGLSVEQTFAATVGTVLSLVGDGAAAEGGTVALTVRLSAVRDVPTAFSWKVLADADPATADADSGEYGDASGSGSIAAGETEAAIEIGIADDADVERPREWFVVELTTDAVALGRSRAAVAVLEGVCDRTPAVAAALVAEDCETATDDTLAALRTLSLEDAGIAALNADDLAGLQGLQVLGLRGNALAELPEGLLSAAPALRFVLLGGNRLAALRGDAFAGLSELRELDLSDNALADLPAGVLSGLPELRHLRLDGNALETLPDGLFAGVASLRSARLDGNPGAPFALRAELRRNDAPAAAAAPAAIQATMAAGAPFPVDVSLLATGGGFRSVDGTLTEDAAVPLAAGETAGAELTVAAGDSAAVRVTLSVGEAPDTICDGFPCWRGLTLAAGDPLVLFAAPPTAADMLPEPAPLFGEDLRLPLASLVTAGGLPVARWQATSSNPAVATVRVEAGELVVATEPGVEGATEIEVVATDAAGQSVTVRFQVQVDFYWPGTRRWRLALPAE